MGAKTEEPPGAVPRRVRIIGNRKKQLLDECSTPGVSICMLGVVLARGGGGQFQDNGLSV
jgi:hypothetical protein